MACVTTDPFSYLEAETQQQRWDTVERFIDQLNVDQLQRVMDAPRWCKSGQGNERLIQPGWWGRMFGDGDGLLDRNAFGFYPRQAACLVEHAFQMRYGDAVRIRPDRCSLEPGADFMFRVSAASAAGAFDMLCLNGSAGAVAKRIKAYAKRRYAMLKIAELPFSVRKQDAAVDVKPVLPLVDQPTKDLFAGAGV